MLYIMSSFTQHNTERFLYVFACTNSLPLFLLLSAVSLYGYTMIISPLYVVGHLFLDVLIFFFIFHFLLSHGLQ